MSDVLVRAADGTARMATHDVAAHLLSRLGRTLTAYLAGSKSRAMPARWAAPPSDPAHAVPSDDKAGRLRAAHVVLRSIEDAENDEVARNWLISANPRLGGVAPVELVREGKFPAVYGAVEAFLADTYHA